MARERRPVDLERLEPRFFRLYELAKFPAAAGRGSSTAASSTTSRSALRSRRSGSAPPRFEVDRRLLYLEPDPGDATEPGRTGAAPSTVVAAIGGLTGLPRSEPILDDLVEVGALNERVRRIRDIIETSWDTVEARVRELVGPLPEIPDDPADTKLADIRKRTEEEARRAQASATRPTCG